MQRNRPPSAQSIRVLRALAADPAQWRYGYDLATEVHLKSGSLYPILIRLADRGLVEACWQDEPRRHLYRLTADGLAAAALAGAAEPAARPEPRTAPRGRRPVPRAVP